MLLVHACAPSKDTALVNAFTEQINDDDKVEIKDREGLLQYSVKKRLQKMLKPVNEICSPRPPRAFPFPYLDEIKCAS